MIISLLARRGIATRRTRIIGYLKGPLILVGTASKCRRTIGALIRCLGGTGAFQIAPFLRTVHVATGLIVGNVQPIALSQVALCGTRVGNDPRRGTASAMWSTIVDQTRVGCQFVIAIRFGTFVKGTRFSCFVRRSSTQHVHLLLLLMHLLLVRRVASDRKHHQHGNHSNNGHDASTHKDIAATLLAVMLLVHHHDAVLTLISMSKWNRFRRRVLVTAALVVVGVRHGAHNLV